MARFDGTVALISGGARGMGASHARGLVAEGAEVVVGDVLDDDGRAVAEQLGDAAHYVHLDVTSEADWQGAVKAAESQFGPVNLLVNNAGIVMYGPITDMDPDDFRRVIDINLTGTFLGMHYTVPSMRRAGGGVIINISSTAGIMGYATIGAYTASKWGVRGMTKTAAMELGRDGIRVMSIHPGPIRTPMTDDLGDAVAGGQPIPRMGEPEEVTKLLLFMAADATYSTGSEWVIDGGALLGPIIDLPTE
ncbi:MAG: SDR family oxidoreductase [Acidimicrobiia bacterium]|nr:SDR family oxidoreductase [Acidimicrobiia bacterium]